MKYKQKFLKFAKENNSEQKENIIMSKKFKKLVESIELDENFSSYNNINQKTKLITFDKRK